MTTSIKTKRLSPSIGVEITGIDLSQPLSADIFEELQTLLDNYHLLYLPRQHLSAEEQIRFTSAFGPVVDESGTGSRRYCYVSNRRVDGAVSAEAPLLWHSDNMWSPAPTHYIALYGTEVVGDLAATRFACAERACSVLTDALRQEVEGLRTINMTDLPPAEAIGDKVRSSICASDNRVVLHELPADEFHFPRTSYPIIWKHPRTGEKLLTVQEDISVRIEDLGPEESERIYQTLFAVLYDEAYIYDHHWQKGDYVLWDNLALQHSRRGFYGAPGVRTLRRTVINPMQEAYFEHAPRVRQLGEFHRSITED